MVIHTHTYMAVVILCMCLTLSNMTSLKRMLAFALGAGLISLWLYATLHGKSHAFAMVRSGMGMDVKQSERRDSSFS